MEIVQSFSQLVAKATQAFGAKVAYEHIVDAMFDMATVGFIAVKEIPAVLAVEMEEFAKEVI